MEAAPLRLAHPARHQPRPRTRYVVRIPRSSPDWHSLTLPAHQLSLGESWLRVKDLHLRLQVMSLTYGLRYQPASM